MRPDQLSVVTVVSNPMLWRSRVDLARRVIPLWLAAGVRVTLVECAYGDRPFQLTDLDGVEHVPVRAKTLVWNKEGLGNIGIARTDAEYIAFVDADVIFRNPSWALDTLNALQLYDVVWPWSDCYDLGPKDEHLDAHRSFGRVWIDRQPIMQGPRAPRAPYKFAHPGYAIAFRRSALDALGGLIDTAALGAGDHHMAMALIGRVRDSMPAGVNPGYAAPLQRWEENATRFVAGNIGYVPGTIEHLWHGQKTLRKYVSRWRVLLDNDFDPASDLKRNSFGLYELALNKPALRRDINAYFGARDEDATTLG